MRVTGRLIVLYENACDALYRDGVTRADGEPRALMARVAELGKMIRDNLDALGDADHDDDLLARLRQ